MMASLPKQHVPRAPGLSVSILAGCPDRSGVVLHRLLYHWAAHVAGSFTVLAACIYHAILAAVLADLVQLRNNVRHSGLD